MRTAALGVLFVACSCAANAQKFSLLPQVGFENSRTVIRYNDLPSFSPLGSSFSPQASLRLNYASKQGIGFFVGVATSRSTVSFAVADPQNALNSYTATAGNMQVRLEGGYQFTSPKINLGKASAKSSAVSQVSKKSTGNYSYRCGRSSSYNRCGTSRRVVERIVPEKIKSPAWIRLQPSIGMGFIPSTRTDVVIKNNGGYEYRAGNWNTALVTGANIEIGKRNTPIVTVSVNYFNAMGNLKQKTFSTQVDNKAMTSSYQSDVSGWNLRVGLPITFAKKPATKIQKPAYKPQSKSCGYKIYRSGRAL